jgi:60 kDa SS-A/Ro ribonucleoprotein
MATLNKKATIATSANAINASGFPAEILTDNYKLLLKQTCSCMLFEPTYYASGTTTAAEIATTALKLSVEEILAAAQYVNGHFHLRTVSTYLIATAIVKRNQYNQVAAKATSADIERAAASIITRPDMLTELFVQFQHLTSADTTFPKVLHRIAKERMAAFSEYQIAKYANIGGLKLRDVLRIAHPKTKDQARNTLYKALIDNTVVTPDTWNKRLSAGADKKTTWESMLQDGTLGGIAILKNLRNMLAVNVDPKLISNALKNKNLFKGALITQIMAAQKYSRNYFTNELTELLEVVDIPKLDGTTVFLVDVSGSMNTGLSAGSELQRMDAATGLAAIGAKTCQNSLVFSFSQDLVQVLGQSNYPFAYADAIKNSQGHISTRLGEALTVLNNRFRYDRLVIITDEEYQGSLPSAINNKSYVVNVGVSKTGILTQQNYTRINGFSPMVLKFIAASEEL